MYRIAITCNMDQILINACITGNYELALSAIEKGAKDFNKALAFACYHVHPQLALLMIEKGATNYYNHLMAACMVGDYELALNAIKFGAINPYYNPGLGLYYACCFNHEKLVLLMIEKGANNFNEGLGAACYKGYEKLVLLMIEKGATNFDNGLAQACYGGHEKLAKLMIEKGATNFNKGLRFVHNTRQGLKLVSYMVEKGANIDYYDHHLNEIELEYLLHKNVTKFGKYENKVKIISNFLKLRKQVLSVFFYIGLINDILKF